MIMCRKTQGVFTVVLTPTFFSSTSVRLRVCVLACVRACVLVSLQEVLLDPHRLLLLVQYALSDDADEVVDPGPGLGFHAGVETGDDLQLFLLRPTQPHQLLLRLQAKRQLPVWTGNRKETVLLVVTLVLFRTWCV